MRNTASIRNTIFLALPCLFLSAKLATAAAPITRDYLVRHGISSNAAGHALNSYEQLNNELENKDSLVIVDFTKAAYEKRMYIVNMKNGAIDPYHVTHGVNSGANWMLRTSNALAKSDRDIGSHRSAIGNFKTLTTKHSDRTGFSLTVDGLDDDNKNTFRRFIYVHGSKDVNLEWPKTHKGIFKRSEGCFVVHNSFRDKVIAQIKGGALLFAYWSRAEMLRNYRSSMEGILGWDALLKGLGQWQPDEELPSP